VIDPVSGMDMSQFGATPPPALPPSAASEKGTDPVSGIDFGQQNFPQIPKDAPQSTIRGIARNIGAGLQEGAAGTMNVLSDPFGNLIGKPLVTAGVFAHDLLAPHFGGQRFTDEQRNALLNDDVPQPGTRLVNAIDTAGGAPTPEQVPAVGGAEQAVRAGVGGAAGMIGLGPAGPVANALMGAGGALAGHAVDQSSLPEWAKPAASLGANVAGNIATGGVVAGANKLASGTTSAVGKLGI
jgi:hypothetical protein